MYLKRANDVKQIQIDSFCFRGASEICHTHQRYNKYLTNLVFSVRTVSYGSSFFPLRFTARALRAWAINRRGKNSVRNLQYGPRTRLVRSIYMMIEDPREID